MLDINKVKETFKIPVLVQFATENGTVVQGQFIGDFKRLPNPEIDDMIDADPPLLNSETIEKVLVGVSGIGDGTAELSPEESLAWVKKTPECVQAAVAAFFRSMRPERYSEKTSRKQRRG